MKRIYIGMLLMITFAALPNVNAASMMIKTGETQIFSVNTSQATNTTWYLDQNIVLAEESFEYNHTFTFSPNATNIGYHNITFIGQNENGSVSMGWTDIFIGTLFVANGDIVNATTNSMLVEPNGNFNLTTFVENVSADFIPKNSNISKIEYEASSTFLSLSGTRSGVGETMRLSNGSSYMLPFNTTNKNGTFLISLNSPYAEKLDGQRINVSVIASEVRVSPAYDINGDFKVNGADSTILRLHWLENTTAMNPKPRYDMNFVNGTRGDGIVNGVDSTILRLHFNETIPTV